MFQIVEPDRRILFMDTHGQTVIGFSNFCGESDRVFDIPFNDLATNKALLETLHLESMYADGEDKKHAVEFFNYYLGSFYNDKGIHEKLSVNPIIRILVQDKERLTKVQEIFA